MSDITLQFGPTLTGSISIPVWWQLPQGVDNWDAEIFDILFNSNETTLHSITFASPELSGFEFITLLDNSFTEPLAYQLTGPGFLSKETLELSAIPIPAALPLFGSVLGLMGIAGWKRK